MAKNNSLKERLRRKQEDLKKRGGKRSIIFLKEGTLRVRILPTGEENDFILEVVHIYLGGDIGGFISPATFGEPCAVMEKYEQLKESKNDSDKDLAKKMAPKKKGVAFVITFTDKKGKEIDTENSKKCLLLPNTLYQQILDLYFDEDEWGDMTDPLSGFDLKLIRTGKGKMDTEYTCNPCQKTKLPKEYRTPIKLDEEVRKIIPSYEETQEILEKFLGGSSDKDDDDDEPKRKDRSLKDKKKKHKKSDL